MEDSVSTMKIVDNIVHTPPLKGLPIVSLGQYLFDCLQSNSDHILQIDVKTGQQISCKYVLENSIILSNFIRNHGINVEDRISIAIENHPSYVIAMCSTFFVGATYAPLNPAYTEREYRHMLEILQPRLIFVSQRTEKLLAKIAATLSWPIKLIEMDDQALDKNIITLKEILEKHKNVPTPFVPTKIDDIAKRMAAIMCSSGTTGFPKGVMLSHRNILCFIWTGSGPQMLDIEDGDRTLIFLPMFHGYALAIMTLAISTSSIMCLMRSFDMETLLKSVGKYKITHLPLVPPVLVALSKHPSVSKHDFSSVKQILCGAAALPGNIVDKVKKRTKVKHIRNGYGMTELSMITNVSNKTSTDDNVGPMVRGLNCKVIDPKTGKKLGPREIGELCFTGPQLMLGYFKNPEATAETIDKDNWLHSGDLGYFNEEGCLYITGRIKELIKYKGFQVSPIEIEEVILTHPCVLDAGVIGIPDEASGELPMAFVVKKPNKNLTEKEIVDFTSSHLSPQKRLRGGVKFVNAIPKTASGKILRRDLRNMLSKL